MRTSTTSSKAARFNHLLCACIRNAKTDERIWPTVADFNFDDNHFIKRRAASAFAEILFSENLGLDATTQQGFASEI